MKRVLLVGLLLLGSNQLYANQAITVEGGYIHTSSSAYDDSGTVGVRYEYSLSDSLSIGPEYTYHGPMAHRNGQDVSYGDVSGHSVLLDILYYPSVSWKVKPYILGGIGVSFWDFKNETPDVTVKLGDSFAYKVGLGATYPINSSWSILTEWSFFKTEIPKEARNSDGSESILLGDDHGKIGEEEFSLTLGVKYSF